MQPCMTRREAAALRDALSRARHYFEFGAGGSTVAAAAEPAVATVTAVDSDPAWVRRVVAAAAPDRVRGVHVDIGATGEWGYPKGGGDAARWRAYPASYAAHRHPHTDLVLNDGRFRVACAAAVAAEHAAAPATAPLLLWHDYARAPQHPGRPHYASAEAVWAVEATVESLVFMRLRSDVDVAAAARQLGEAFAADPR